MRIVKGILGSQLVLGCLSITGGLLLFIALAYAILLSADKREQALLDLNDGYGTGDNPILPGEWLQFHGYRMRFPTIQYMATPDLIAMSANNPAPAPGNQQIMVRVEVECQRDYCNGEAMAAQIEVITEERMPRGESPVYILDDDLKQYEATDGESFSGWLVFQISEDHEVRLIEVTDFDERVSLYAFAPPPGS